MRKRPRTIRQDGKLIAIELQNGHIERYTAEEAPRAKSLSIFGADNPPRYTFAGGQDL
jgi:hypothetical protein